MLRPIYKRITCKRVECAAITYRRMNNLSDYFRIPCDCNAGVLVKVINGCETTGDNDINPRLFFKRKFKSLEVDCEN